MSINANYAEFVSSKVVDRGILIDLVRTINWEVYDLFIRENKQVIGTREMKL